ncbi:MAG: C-GCAxxG-C-C family protein [Oscillospiraceae bacterium]|nr:C-GCAxxG-C-C family protein [Oscillospiraceae bacterium]
MTKQEVSVALHAQGYNCAQCVLMAMRDHTGLSEELSASVAAGFGGGAGCRELCGALSGSFMAVGTVLGADHRPQVQAADREITAAFREKFGAVRCADLKAAGVPCDDLIAFAADKTESVLNQLKEE